MMLGKLSNLSPEHSSELGKLTNFAVLGGDLKALDSSIITTRALELKKICPPDVVGALANPT